VRESVRRELGERVGTLSVCEETIEAEIEPVAEGLRDAVYDTRGVLLLLNDIELERLPVDVPDTFGDDESEKETVSVPEAKIPPVVPLGERVTPKDDVSVLKAVIDEE
jgi:hypothetical protein